MLNTEFIRHRGIPALRSGAYDQSHHCFYDIGNHSFCAMGVLLETARQDGLIELDWLRNRADDLLDAFTFIFGSTNTFGPAITVDGIDHVSVAQANDNAKLSHAKIADGLELLCDQQDAVLAAQALLTAHPDLVPV